MRKKYFVLTLLALALCGATSAFAAGCGETHSLVKVEAAAPTCTAAGNTEYYKCYDEGCGKVFSDANGKKEVSLESVTIKATGHTVTGIGEEKPATCTEDGLTAGEKCSVCGALITERQVIKKNGHRAVKVEGRAATCEKDGEYTHYDCSDCGKSFLDEDCTVIAESYVIKATGHDWGEWQPAGGGRHKKVCANDNDHVETEDCSYGKISDFTDGSGHYLTCGVCGGTSDKLPHNLKYYIDGGEHWTECRSCDYVSDRVSHAPARLAVEVTGSKLYGGRTITLSDLSVTSVCECGHEEPVAAENLTFEDTVLTDGLNELTISFGEFSDTFAYDAPEEPRYTLKIDGALFESGASELALKEGEIVTDDTVAPASGKTFIGLRSGLDIVDLPSFVMPDKDVTLVALYEEDMPHFAPANKCQTQYGDELYEHVVLDNGIVATRFVWTDNTDVKKPHTASDTRTHKINVHTPAHGKSLMFIYVVNNGDKDVTLDYEIENYGNQGNVTFTAKARSTTRVPLVYGGVGGYGTFSTADHWISVKSEIASGESVTLDIYGRLCGTDNNKVTGISAKLPKLDYAEGENIDLTGLEVTASVSGYNITLSEYTCNVADGEPWTQDISEITVSYAGFVTRFKLNSMDSWVQARFSKDTGNVSGSPAAAEWFGAEYVYDEETGLPSTRYTFKAGSSANWEAFVNPSTDAANADKGGYNVQIPLYNGEARTLRVFVKNLSGQTLHFRVFAENWGDIGGAEVNLEAGQSDTYEFTVTSTHGSTPGCHYNFKLLSDIGAEDAAFEIYAYYRTDPGEATGISINSASPHTATFTVGDTFSARNLTVDLALAGNPITDFKGNVVNFTTDLDGYVFTADDVGEKTVTVSWNGLSATYKINVVPAA